MTAKPASKWREFQSTPPVKAATRGGIDATPTWSFQSTPPVKAATSMVIYDLVERRISIHAAREGGDCYACRL